MNTNSSLQARLWQEVLAFSIALAGLASIFFWFLQEQGWQVFAMTVLAVTSGVLLAMSFSLSSFAYYFDFLDSKVVYRKQLGLMGYFVALGYGLVAVSAKPALYIGAFPKSLFTIEVGLGVIAMAIFTVMALISNVKAVKLLGGKLWKDILGLGYIAYALLVIRGIFLDAVLWQQVFAGDVSSITPRMALTLLGTAVLCFRVSVPFHKQYVLKHSQSKESVPETKTLP